MEITPAPSTVPLCPQRERLARGDGAILGVHQGGELSFEIRCRSRRQLPLLVAPGAAALVIAGTAGLLIDGHGIQRAPMPALLPRLLGFYDDASATDRPALIDTAAPAVMVLPAPLSTDEACRDWLLGQLVMPSHDFAAVAAVLARTEVYQVVRFVLANAALNVQQLAARYGLSTAQFRRVTLRAFGRPLKEQLRLVRASRALQSHAESGASFTRVADEFGFSSPSHFCNEIKSLLGQSPRAIFRSIKVQ